MNRSRGRYVVKRILFSFVTIFVITSVLFFLFRLVPGDAADRLAGPRASVEDREQVRKEFCLDKGILEQYARCYLGELTQGNLGLNHNHQPVTQVIWQKLKISVPLVLAAEIVAITLGLMTGVIAAARRRTWFDKGSTVTALIFYSFPTQWFGLMMLLVFAGSLKWLPSGGRIDIFAGNEGFAYLLDLGKHMILPVLTLGLVLFGEYTLIVRSTMLETLGEDYILTARAKGMPRKRIIWRHAFRNASPPIVALLALSLAFVVAGSVLTEAVFSWPGIGLEFYDALALNDWATLNGITLVLIIAVVIGNLVADLMMFKLDPRITE